MKNLKIILVLVLFFSFTNNGWSNDPREDSIRSFNSFNLFKLKNPWLNSGNLAGITFNSNEKIGEINGGYQLTDGNYHRIREATHKEDYSLFSESYQVIKNIHFYGKINYHLSNENGGLWVGVFDPYRGNPYIIADSVSGTNYHKESFQLSGGAAKKLNNKISVGILTDYFVGVGAKQKDPRPKNTVTDFKVNPSIILFLPDSKLGFDISFQNRKEEISYEQVATDNTYPTYFMFKGMGFFNYEIAQNEFRFQSENNCSGGIQYETTLFNFQSFTEIRGLYSLETIDDGSSTTRKEDAGDWKTYDIELKQQLTRQDDESIKKITFNGKYFNGDGIEYTQEKVTNDDNFEEYETLAKNLKFNRKTITANLKFEYLKFATNKEINWEASAFTGFKMNNEKYYYIPEIFNADYSNVEAGTSFEKNFYWNNIHFAPSIMAKYQYNLSQEINLSNDATITKRQNKELYTHDFEYYTSDVLNVSAFINCEKTLKKKNIDKLSLKMGYEYWYTNANNKGIFTGKIGFMF